MLTYLASMALLIVIGVVWRCLLGSESAAESHRQALTRSVYLWFLPALVLHMLWQAGIDSNTFRIPALAALCILASAAFAWLAYRFIPAFHCSAGTLGALLLAASFGNFTYIGLPVLTGMFGEQAGIIAIQFDLLAATPLLFSAGVLLASHYGHGQSSVKAAIKELVRVPALWAAALGLLSGALHIPLPAVLEHSLQLLGQAVIPLMLLAVGMALQWQRNWFRQLPLLMPVLLAQLILMPSLAWWLASMLSLDINTLNPVVIEAAMPTMVLGLVICDRFKLNTVVYAEAITTSTLASLISLPAWLWLLTEA